MNEQQIRAAVLEMALRYCAGTEFDPLVEAQRFFDFIVGENK